ncbi:GNAT family N-acetyltransferase [Leptospira yasudae]|uniref:GNAT family N-acetyltransferase n=1 Tax=Leptospira yasudae TaxID=2202201 RepID=UPI000E59D7DF|nr:GNAT family N-acetyltransferase [Leptospira yasudae]RHX94418.1 GNAT family N-acetyltransferase [Leptospira yasudae]
MRRDFTFHKNFRDDPVLREAFFRFTPPALYGADFRLWYDFGFWEDSYIPYCLMDGKNTVANASVCEMKLLYDGKEYDAVQLATVGTLSEYRNQGLSRILLERIFEDYRSKTSFFFLFGNESVVDFYPKWGFANAVESRFILKHPARNSSPKRKRSYRVLNVHSEEDRTLFRRIANSSLPVTKRFGARNYGFILSFYWLYAFPENFFYFPDQDAILVFQREGNVLWLHEVLCQSPFSLSDFFAEGEGRDAEEVRFGFCPDGLDVQDLAIEAVSYESDSPLFVKGFGDLGKLPFHFPILART